MSLATRCTACGTIFRVVQDQLRVSDGWVRCGRCAEVFDAREQLFDLDREAPPPWPAPSPQSEFGQPAQDDDAPEPPPVRHAPAPAPVQPPPPVQPAAPAPASYAPPSASSAMDPHPAPHPAVRRPIDVAADRRADNANLTPPPPAAAPADWHKGGTHASDSRAGERVEPFWAPPPEPAAESPSEAIAGDAFAAEVDAARADLPEPKGLRFDPEPAAAPEVSPSVPAAPMDTGPDVILSPRLQSAQADAGAAFTEAFSAPDDAPATPPAASVRKPGFLRRAEGEARWQRPGVRIALSLGTLLLIGTAAAQLTWHYRDALAAQSPVARQWLGDACEKLGCAVQPWRRLDAFKVESTGLSEAASGNHYKFSLSLRNRSPWELATPWVELSLNDGNGKVLMKKALKPEDFVNGRPATAASSEQSLQLVFSTGKQRVNGYTVEIFYP